MKIKALILSAAIITTVLAGCGQKQTPAPTPTPTPTTPAPATGQTPATGQKPADAVTTPSIVDNNDAFKKAISRDGRWIICMLKDLTFTEELLVDGDFKNGKKDDKGTELYQRKVALYTQDDNKKVTARFTLTAPKITFNSVNGSLEHGTFKGDVYVSGKNFKIVNQKIDGNLYFLNEEAKNTFKIADKEGNPASVITGKQELKK
jgi:hypothetical protein